MGTIADLNELTTPAGTEFVVVRTTDVSDKDKKLKLDKLGLLNAPQTWLQAQGITVTSTSPALRLQQNGTGLLLDGYDGATPVLRVQDGGRMEIAQTIRALTPAGLRAEDDGGLLGWALHDGGGISLRRAAMVTLANMQLSAGVFAEPAVSAEAPAVAGRAEIIQTWGVSDNSGDSFALANSSLADGRFSPSFFFRNTTATPETFAIGYETLPANDTGTDPCIVLSALRRTSTQAFSAIANRPILEVRNLSAFVFKIWASGAMSVPFIYNTNAITGSAVGVVDTAGTLQKITSSARFKRSVRDLPADDEFLLRLRPVLYKDKAKMVDGEIVAFKKGEDSRDWVGLIAEEVDAAGGKDFVVYNEKGEAESLMYDRLVAPLIGAVQRLLARVEKLELELKGA